MTVGGAQLRTIFADTQCVPAASIFDPLSARLAELAGWRVCKLAGSVAKAAELALPDGAPLANASDLVEICRRISRVVDRILMVDVDDGGANPLSVYRLVRDLEAVGVAAIEIEDNVVPQRLGPASARHAQLVSTEWQVEKLQAALASRRESSTVIIGRTSALNELPLADALRRIEAYAGAGVDALMLPGVKPKTREEIEGAHAASGLPLCVVGLTRDQVDDLDFLNDNQVRVRYFGQPVYGVAVKAIYDCLVFLLEGGSLEDLAPLRASPELMSAITRSSELAEWERNHAAKLQAPSPPNEGAAR